VAEHLLTYPNNSTKNRFLEKNYSTEAANCFMLENIKLKMDKGGVACAVFLDFKKTVNILLSRLSNCNFLLKPLCGLSLIKKIENNV